MNAYYPIMLQLHGKKVVVVGGGKVAERKVLSLSGTGASITVISPQATDELKMLSENGEVAWLQRPFTESDVTGAWLVFAATNVPEINKLVKEAAGPHQLVMLADDPDASDFHLPAQLKRGRLTIAVSTGGASPSLAKKIRDGLEDQFDEAYEEYLEFLFSKRKWIVKEIEDKALKRRLLAALVSNDFLNSSDREQNFQRLYEKMVQADT